MILEPGSFIWATRGRSWGFRFLRDGGFSDPLPVYEAAFAGTAGQREICQRVGDLLVLRFVDPEGRKDHARRVISHDFVVLPPASNEIQSPSDGVSTAWNSVANEYDRIWDAASPVERTAE
ncbi:hypothetical protein [uncultured Microbacterium sp.]|uniref:hypothetical protein n=1 Tax=uncultured Microbacterium sp. TaxID=191216 RepID=UPI0026128B8F|nr:hypothetical protein [uncultured Microbacterium sp.]